MEKRISGWKRELLRAHERVAGVFARSEARELSHAYLQGLLSRCEYVLEELSSSDAVLIADETGFLKKSEHLVGVKRL